ncbi:chitin binding protein [Stagonosporopsis vannaccii]|nr:chitin binding protein [Stagonosporopsis vannaccii]
MKSYTAAVALAGFASSVAAHGFISSPTPRMPGEGLKAACGDQVYNQQSSDHYGNVQGALQNLQGEHPDCRMWQCKGVPFEDAGEIFEYTAGQVIPMKVEIRAPHDGVANVSIVNIKTDKVVGSPLISWDEYALTSSPISAHPDWTDFEITMPDVSSECANKGDCVIQWYWDAPSIDQTYESCIDFTMGGGSGSGSGNSTAPAPASSSAPAASSPAATQAPASSAAPSAPAATSAAAEATPVETSAPAAPSATGSAGSDAATLPEEFTIEQFVSWLEATAGSGAASKLRRAIAARTARTHARAFRG